MVISNQWVGGEAQLNTDPPITDSPNIDSPKMPSTFLDSTLFKKMYTTPAMREIFADSATVGRYLEVERALAKAQAELE